jgi:hypothetical protein
MWDGTELDWWDDTMDDGSADGDEEDFLEPGDPFDDSWKDHLDHELEYDKDF